MGGVSVLHVLEPKDAGVGISKVCGLRRDEDNQGHPVVDEVERMQLLITSTWRYMASVGRHNCTVDTPEIDELEFEESNSLRSLAYATIGQAYLDYEHGLTRAENMANTNNKKFADKMINDYKSAESFMYPRCTYQEEGTLFILELAHLSKERFVLANLTLSARLGRSIPAGTLPSWTLVK